MKKLQKLLLVLTLLLTIRVQAIPPEYTIMTSSKVAVTLTNLITHSGLICTNIWCVGQTNGAISTINASYWPTPAFAEAYGYYQVDETWNFVWGTWTYEGSTRSGWRWRSQQVTYHALPGRSVPENIYIVEDAALNWFGFPLPQHLGEIYQIGRKIYTGYIDDQYTFTASEWLPEGRVIGDFTNAGGSRSHWAGYTTYFDNGTKDTVLRGRCFVTPWWTMFSLHCGPGGWFGPDVSGSEHVDDWYYQFGMTREPCYLLTE